MRFAISKIVITYGLEVMLAILKIIQGLATTIMNSAGFGGSTPTILPNEIIKAIEACRLF